MAWLGSRLKSFESVKAHHTVMHSITALKIGQNHHHWSYHSWFSGQDSSGTATYSQVRQKSATKDDWEVCEVRSAKWEVRSESEVFSQVQEPKNEVREFWENGENNKDTFAIPTTRVFAISGFSSKRLSKSSSSKSFFTEKKSNNDFVGQEGRTRFLWCLFNFIIDRRSVYLNRNMHVQIFWCMYFHTQASKLTRRIYTLNCPF